MDTRLKKVIANTVSSEFVWWMSQNFTYHQTQDPTRINDPDEILREFLERMVIDNLEEQ